MIYPFMVVENENEERYHDRTQFNENEEMKSPTIRKIATPQTL